MITKSGEVLYGIQPHYPVSSCATVRGLVCSQENRDHFRVSVSSLIAHRISPPVASGTVTVHMWPVLDKVTKPPVDNLFVVGIVIRKPSCLQPTLYTAVSGHLRHSYMRRAASSCRMTPTDVYSWMIDTLEQSKLSHINSAEHEINVLQEIKQKILKQCLDICD